MNVIWIAEAPDGVVSTGPAVVRTVEGKQKYEAMGWTIEGPYYHQSEMPPTCIACPECGSEVDTREAERL
jgi:hypothetical protein